MDANGQKFWMVRGEGWQPEVPGSLALGPSVQLASETIDHVYPERIEEANARLDRVPMARDAFGGRAYYDPALQAVFGTSDFPGAEKIVDLPAPATDLALGTNGLFYLAVCGVVLVRDARGRWPSVEVQLPGFKAWRLAPAPLPEGGAWVLDRANKQLARLTGQLWPAPLALSVPPDAFVPVEENPHPLRMTRVAEPWLAPEEDPVAIACSPAGKLAVLHWFTDPAHPLEPQARVRLFQSGATALGPTAILTGVRRPFSLAWISETRFAVLTAGGTEAVIYTFAEGEVRPSGEVFPLRDHDGGPFLHGVSWPIEYPTPGKPRPLVSVSAPSFLPKAVGRLIAPLDSGNAGTVWHRLYIEADIPNATGLTLWLAATDQEEDARNLPEADWHPHHFGAARPGASSVPDEPATPDESKSVYDLEPLAAWVPGRSEIPGFAGYCPDEPQPGRAGLFTVLIQRAHRPVRTLRGRFLQVRIELRGNLRSTPCLHALRAYGPRFSYQDKYLPSVYREQEFGAEADRVTAGEPSTRADFLGRFLANFEGILTPLEDRIASAWRLTDPRTTPDNALDWLGNWIGVAFEPWYPAERRRERLRQAPELFRRRGTLDGLRLALDIATAGAVLGDAEGRRRIVVVEDYWMRRTLATVLGVNLERTFDPLFGGPVFTGNSLVGRTLFLTEGIKREVMALFDAAIPLSPEDQAAVDDFFASLAHRATVLVHETVRPEEMTLIERIAAQETPAHAVVRVRRASQDFMVGLAALLGADTYLRPSRPAEAVEVNKSAVGDGSVLLRPPSLDPRIEGTA